MIPYDLPAYFMLSWLFLYGAVIGSFLTVCVHRLPQHSSILAAWRSLIHNPSHCDRCEQKLLARDNIPIFGWLLLGGRCRFCQKSIPIKYPLIELVNGLLFVVVYALEVPLNHWTPIANSSLSCALSPTTFANAWDLSPLVIVNSRYLYHLILVEALFVASLIDWESMTIPDAVTVPALLAGVIGAATFGKFWIVPVWFQDVGIAQITVEWLPEAWRAAWLTESVPGWIAAHPHIHGLAVSLTGLFVGGGIVWMVRGLAWLALRREAMGFGDVVFMAMVGSFIGWQAVIVAFFIAPALALIAALSMRTFRTGREIPYGPYLSLGTMAVLLGWRWIWPCVEWYFSLGLLLIVIALAMTFAVLPLLLVWQQVKHCLKLSSGDQHVPAPAVCLAPSDLRVS